MRGGWVLAVVALSAAAAGCADVWGFEQLDTSDGGHGGGSSGGGSGDDGGASDGASFQDGHFHPNTPDGSAPQGSDAGSCVSDISVSCSGPSQSGFTCSGAVTPAEALGNLSCGAGVAGAGGTSYCCTGNWCGESASPGDGQQCGSCYIANCTAPMCACDADPTLDDGGYSECSDYAQCLANCQAPTLADCEDRCSPGYSATEIAEGNAETDCIAYYCGGPCGLTSN